jgi:hypothetical protein
MYLCVIVMRPLLGFGIYNFTYPKKTVKRVCNLLRTHLYFDIFFNKIKKGLRKLHQILKRGYSMWQTFSLARKGILVGYDRSFEDHKRTVGKLKNFFFRTLSVDNCL